MDRPAAKVNFLRARDFASRIVTPQQCELLAGCPSHAQCKVLRRSNRGDLLPWITYFGSPLLWVHLHEQTWVNFYERRGWKWHMAEEFEHREVCFNLYHELYSKGLYNKIVNGWLYRVYGFVRTVRHLGAYIERVSTYLIEKDRETMSPEELMASEARLK